MGFLIKEQIESMGFKSVGENTLLSDKASYYNCKNISIGNNVRIDDFVVLSAGVNGIAIGNYIHVAVFSSLIGAGRIILKDFCNISSKVSIYSSNDDYSGEYMTNPMLPSEFTNVTHGAVSVGRHVIVGSGSVILPNVTLEDGVAVGALSLVTKDCTEFGVYIGVPAKRVKERSRRVLDLERQFLSRGL